MADKNALRQVYEAIWPKAKEDHFTEEGMPEFGIRHFTDAKLENRLEAYRLLMQFINAKIEATTLNEYVDELRERLEALEVPIRRRQPSPCREIFGELRGKAWPEEFTPVINELSGQLSKYLFEDALSTVKRLLQRLGQEPVRK